MEGLRSCSCQRPSAIKPLWPLLAAAILDLAGCASSELGGLSTAAPGLAVARAALDGGAPDIALRISEENLGRKPGDLDALLVEADSLSALGRMKEAETAYRLALAMDRRSAEARMGLGRLSLGVNPVGAEALFLEVLAQDPRNAKALNNLGVARDLQGRHAEAQDSYRRALGIDPSSHAAATNLALSIALSSQRSNQLNKAASPGSCDIGPRVC